MAQCNGLALSQQLSQVCLHTPRNSNLQEEHASQTSSDAVEQENPLEHICSQDFFWCVNHRGSHFPYCLGLFWFTSF